MQQAGSGAASNPRLAATSLAALGIVFGDIGTSPLYTLKTVLDLTGAHPDAKTILGSLSLILWTLVVVTTIKYVAFAMRIDNDGEGGVIALMTLLGVKKRHRPAIVAAGLFGAALIYGVWAPAWCDAVGRSTGFAPPRREVAFAELPDSLKPIAEAARPLYERLARHKLAPKPVSAGAESTG
jgi:hypothetical protein